MNRNPLRLSDMLFTSQNVKCLISQIFNKQIWDQLKVKKTGKTIRILFSYNGYILLQL